MFIRGDAMQMYQQINKNKRNTVFFIIVFIGLIFIASYFIGYLIDPALSYSFAGIALILAGVGVFLSYYNSDKMILKMANARPVSKAQEPYLYHTIEGVAIAAGIPTPKAYVIETDIPNAFATGRNPEHGVVAVTRGLIDRLNREELEGVIAHEMAHIKNYDILYSSIVIVLAGTLVYIAEFASRSMMFGGGNRNNNSNNKGNPVMLIIGIVTIILAPILAKIVQMAVSRSREYLADATAARMIGYPRGLASALHKIAEYSNPQQAKQAGIASEATASLFIVNPLLKPSQLNNLFSTHPPIDKRIEALNKM
jgi:heat shock protein HtpX